MQSEFIETLWPKIESSYKPDAGPVHQLLHEYVDKYKPGSYLEIGSRDGCSASVVAESHPITQIHCCDFPDNGWGGFGDSEKYLRLNLEKFAKDRHKILIGNSQTINTRLEIMAWGKHDLVYVDGDHSYDGGGTDFITACACLNPGGIILIDDITHHPILGKLLESILLAGIHKDYQIHPEGTGCAALFF